MGSNLYTTFLQDLPAIFAKKTLGEQLGGDLGAVSTADKDFLGGGGVVCRFRWKCRGNTSLLEIFGPNVVAKM